MGPDLPLTPEDVADIVAMLDGGGYDRLGISTSRFTLKVARDGDGWSQEWAWSESGTSAEPAAAAPAEPAAEPKLDEGYHAVRLPLPGTFYRAPQPGAPPFVEIGDPVEPETVVAIVETMKLMNPVHAGARGRIEHFLKANAEPVEADAALMIVRLE